MHSTKYLPPLLFIFLATAIFVTAPTALMASNIDQDNRATLLDQNSQGARIADEGDDQEEEEEDGGGGSNPPDNGQPPPSPPPPGQQFPAIPSGKNLAESNQVGGIGSGNVQQNAQGAVNEQYCKTVGGIGDRRCAQFATPGADNIQECSAVAGLGKANCVQSEQGGGTGTCLNANGRPYICFTDSGAAVSGSGQAGQ